MAKTKCSADEADVPTRGDSAKRRTSPGSTKDTQKAIPASAFKEGARPLHITLTYTPPVSAVPGFVGADAAEPGTFTTGSYGWKGSKRFTVELIDPRSGERNDVQVMLTVNAVAMGSKQAGKEAEAEAEVEAVTSVAGDAEDC